MESLCFSDSPSTMLRILINRWWVNFASLSWIEFFHFLDLSSMMIGTVGKKRIPEVQNYNQVSRSTEVSSPPFDRNSLVDREWVEFSALCLRMKLFVFARSIIDHEPETLVEQRSVNFTPVSPNLFSCFLDLASTILWRSLPIESERTSLLSLQMNLFVLF